MRQEKTIVTDETWGRDADKIFHIKEMSAWDSEKLATSILIVLSRSASMYGFSQPFSSMGVSGLLSILSNIINKKQSTESLGDVLELLINIIGNLEQNHIDDIGNRLMSCVSIVRDKNNPGMTMALLPGDIEEFTTLFKLKKEVLSLMLSFFSVGNK